MPALHISSRANQRGITLVVALVFLLVLSLFAIASFNSSTTNSQVTGNMIARQESQAAAQWLVDSTISSSLFASDPKSVAAGSYSIDIDGDGNIDFQPKLDPAPACERTRTIKAFELDADNAEDVACMTSADPGSTSGTDSPSASAAAGNSLCANTEWKVRAVTDDSVTGTHVAVDQGVGVRVLTTEAEDYCS